MSPRSVKNPHAPSFQLLNNTKQTLTYFQSREQARRSTRSGARAGAGLGEEPGSGGSRQLLAHTGIQLGEGAWLQQPAHMEGHVTAESAPPGLRIRRRVLAPPSNVIKAAAAAPGGAPVLEASSEQECGPQERGLTCVVLVHIPAAVLPQGLLVLLVLPVRTTILPG